MEISPLVVILSNHFHPRESAVHELTIAVVGATGAVGTQFLSILEKRYEKLPKIKLLASSRSAGKVLTVGGQEIVVQETTEGSSGMWTSRSSACPRQSAGNWRLKPWPPEPW